MLRLALKAFAISLAFVVVLVAGNEAYLKHKAESDKAGAATRRAAAYMMLSELRAGKFAEPRSFQRRCSGATLWSVYPRLYPRRDPYEDVPYLRYGDDDPVYVLFAIKPGAKKSNDPYVVIFRKNFVPESSPVDPIEALSKIDCRPQDQR